MEQDSSTETPIKLIDGNKKTRFLGRIFSSKKTYLAILIVSIIIVAFNFIRMLLFGNQKDL